MDLCLRGSQINLVSRKKPKNVNQQRPGSAFTHRLPRSSPLLRRPMSADTRFVKSVNDCMQCSENIICENKLRESNKYNDVNSSSELFQLLLQEPIPRPWMCRRNSENSSECSLGQKIYNVASKQRELMDSCEETSIEEDIQPSPSGESVSKGDEQVTNKIEENETEVNETDKQSSQSEGKSEGEQTLNNEKTVTNNKVEKDFWHDSKHDLPGRVSFRKNDINETEISDGENDATIEDNQAHDKSPATCKKTVHFKENIESPSRGDDPPSKCDAEGCPCAKSRLTSLISVEHKIENDQLPGTTKCFCKFSCNSSTCYTSFVESRTHTTRTTFFSSDFKNGTEGNASNKQTEDVQNPDDKIPENSENFFKKFEKRFEEDKKLHLGVKFNERGTEFDNKFPTFSSYLNAKYGSGTLDMKSSSENVSKASDSPRHEPFDIQQNDNINKNKLSKDKEFSFDENMFEIGNDQDRRTTVTPVTANENRQSASKKRTNLDARNNSTKSINNSRKIKSSPQKYKPKKPTTPLCAREKSNLDEFQMDKVDTWMSLNDTINTNDNNQSRVPSEENIFHDNSPASTSRAKEDRLIISSKSSECSNDDSTYEEIVSVIKEIEEDKKQEEQSDGKSDISFKLHALLGSIETPVDSPVVTKDKNDSSGKLQDILSYLDDVETTCEKTLMETRRSLPESSRSEIEFAIEPDIIEDVPKVADLVILPNHQLARRIVSLSLRANELSNAVRLSKEHVSHIRAEKQKALRQEKTNAANRLKDQKAHYENIVSRHQAFIEQLLKDKTALCEKVSNLTRRLESQNQAWEHKLQTEIVRVKESCLAGEKIRREKWVRDNTKRIKQLTVKGLESEINKMTNEHMKEINELKRLHQQELLDAAEEARLKYEKTEKSIRECCAKDREANIAKERMAIRERFEQQIREEQNSFEEQKNKLIDEFTMERERLYAEMRHKDNEFEEKRQHILTEKERAVSQIYAEFNEKLQKQEQKYEARLSATVQQFESDFLVWKRDYENSCKLREVENENAVRQHYRSERDRQIDAIVAKMDAESLKAQEEFDMKINRLKSKHESDLRESESIERSLKQKCNELRNKLAESEGRVQNLEADMKQMRIELEHSKKMCNEFLEEKEVMKENARKEIQLEIKALQAERDNEIQQIYKRVQQAIEKKDASLEILQKDNAVLRERCIKLEAVIRQQRKDYCIK